MKPRLGHATLGIPHGVKDEAGAEMDVGVTIIHNCLAQRGYAAESFFFAVRSSLGLRTGIMNLNVYTRTSVESRIEAVESLESRFVN